MANREIEIRRIPAVPKAPEIVRVAAYARVSADKDAAFHSLEAQTDYYKNYVASRPDWRLVEIYSDNAISGTVTNRPEFQRMMEDARAGKIDRIITKSITRFARNTVVLLESVRELKRLGVDVYFEKENMHSISPDGELLLTLLAMYAEEEARSASENQKWRIKKKFEQEQPWVGKMLGYRLVDGKLTVVPEEAEIVRRIFSDYLSGMGRYAIAKRLILDGIRPENGNIWTDASIHVILTNEKYTGNMILQKTYRSDFRSKKDKLNRGKVMKYYVENSHEAIIDTETFSRVQTEIASRAAKYHKKDCASYPHLFKGHIRCGHCGKALRYYGANAKRCGKAFWVCPTYYNMGKALCSSQKIPEDILIQKTKEVLCLDNATELTREMIVEHIAEIVVLVPCRLVYRLKGGAEVEVKWQHKSRRESWTPEMRQAARERALKRHAEETEE